MLPPDSHVHSEWSWDAVAGSMARTCARAVDLGLPSVAFTEHADFTPCNVPEGVELPAWWRQRITGHVMTPPSLDVAGYIECLERCRDRFPSLKILSGVELSEPHWHQHRVVELLGRTTFDRVLASVHSLPVDVGFEELPGTYRRRAAVDVIRVYLAEVEQLIRAFDGFDVLAHIDYPVRYWPTEAGPYCVEDFEDDYRTVLATLAAAGRALEVNTRVPLAPQVLRWWHEQGGQAITFASDAHKPEDLAWGFAEAVALAEDSGFGAGSDLHDMWRRT